MHTTLIAYLFVQLMAGQEAWAQYPTSPCLEATTLETTGVTHLNSEATLSAAVFRVPIPTAGVVAFDALSHLSASIQMGIRLLDNVCPDTVEQLDVIRETPGSLLLRVTGPGAIYVTVEPQKPSTLSEDYALYTTFAAEPTTPDTVVMLEANPPASCAANGFPSIGPGSGEFVMVTRADGLTGDVEPEDCDILEGDLADPGVLIFEAEGESLDAALFTGGGCTTPLVAGVLGDAHHALVAPVFAGRHRFALGARKAQGLAYNLKVKHLPLCPIGSGHASLLRCAVALDAGRPVTGELDPGQGTAFTFELETQEAVAITIQGGPVEGALFHGDGVRLASRIVCDKTGCHFGETLPKGRYGLRLESAGDRPLQYAVTLQPTDIR